MHEPPILFSKPMVLAIDEDRNEKASGTIPGNARWRAATGSSGRSWDWIGSVLGWRRNGPFCVSSTTWQPTVAPAFVP